MTFAVPQISKYVEREIMNHKQLQHPHIVELREVIASIALFLQCLCFAGPLFHRERFALSLTRKCLAGVPDARVPGNLHGVCDRWGHVPTGRPTARFAREGCPMVLPAAHHRG